MGLNEFADRHKYSVAEIWDLRADYGNQARRTAKLIMDLLMSEVPQLSSSEPLGNRFMSIPGKMHPVTATFTPYYDHRGVDVALRQRTFDIDGKTVKNTPRLDGYDLVARTGENRVAAYASFESVTNGKIVYAELDPRAEDYDESEDMGVINALSTVYTGLGQAIAELRGQDTFQIPHEPRA